MPESEARSENGREESCMSGFPHRPGRELCRQMEVGVRSCVVLALRPQWASPAGGFMGYGSPSLIHRGSWSTSPTEEEGTTILGRAADQHTLSRLFSAFSHAKQSLSLSLAELDIALRFQFLRQQSTLRKELCRGLMF